MQINPLKQLYTDFLVIFDKCVIKYKSLADKYEDLQMKKDADAYIRAYRKNDTFKTYYRYNIDIIADVMMIDSTKAEYYHYNRDEIPSNFRQAILERQRKYIIDNYVEKNNYYRMLIGLPDYEETPLDYIFIPDDISNELGIPIDIPIHMLDEVHISSLEAIGYIEVLQNKYPTKKYLKYLGDNKIDLITARTALNFSLLKVPYNISESLFDTFTTIYEQCREYFTTCIYISEYRDVIDYYDNFIALCIMVMTIQQIIMRNIKNTAERDFFDEYSVKILFSVYGVPYYSNMDTSTRKQVLQSLNNLVRNKGTNKVIYDIASILGYDRLQVFKYYLIKVQKFNIDGTPVVKYTKDEITGEDVLDYKSMFDIYFQRVAIDDVDTYKSLVNTSNKVSYREIIEDDPYWIEDSDLDKEIYESEYNFVETKYMGVSISYRLTRILFENVYLLKMILEKKDEIPRITLELPKISLYSTVSLFDAIVILCALTCKQNKLKGEILTKPSMILHVLGFNFSRDFEEIKKEILQDPYLDDSLCEFFKDSSCYTAEKLNNLYKNYLNLYDVLVEKMSTTQNINVYHAYKKLYKALYFTKENQSMFNIGTEENPVYASTFMEYLQHTNPDIYEFINSIDSEQLYIYTNHISYKILSIIPDLKYLGIFSDTSSTIEVMLVELIRFFKSYTTDMLGMDTIFVFDLKPETMIRLIEHIIIHKTIQKDDKLNISYSDHVDFTSTVRYSSGIKFIDKIHLINAVYSIFDTIHFMDTINTIHNNIFLPEKTLQFIDIIHHIESDIKVSTELMFKELIKIHGNLFIHSDIKFIDMIKFVIKICLREKMSFYDVLLIMGSLCVTEDSKLLGEDDIELIISILKKTGYSLNDTIHTIYSETDLLDKYLLKDIIKLSVDIILKDSYEFQDNLKNITVLLKISSILNFIDKINEISNNYTIFHNMYLEDIVNLVSNFKEYENLIYLDKFIGYVNLLEKTYLLNADTIKFITKKNELSDTNYLFDILSMYVSSDVNDRFSFRETYKITFI